MIWSPTVKSGLRLVIGSWKIIAISRPRMARICLSGSVARSSTAPSLVAVEDRAADDAARRRQQAHDRRGW